MSAKRKEPTNKTRERNRVRAKQRRADETPEDGLARRQADSQRHAATVLAETPEDGSARRQADSQKHVIARMAETPEDRSARRQADSQRHAATVLAETPEDGSARRQADSQRHVTARMAEAPEDGFARRQADSRRHAERRQFQNSIIYQSLLRRYRLASEEYRRLLPAQRIQILVPPQRTPGVPMPTLVAGEANELDQYPDFFEENEDGMRRLSQRVQERDDRRIQQRAARFEANGMLGPRTFSQDQRDLARLQDTEINELVRQLTPPDIVLRQHQLHDQLDNIRAEIAQGHIRAGHPKYRIACNQTLTDFDETLHRDHHLGKLDNKCGHCGALFFKAEATTKKQYTVCCSNGQIRLPPFQAPPPIAKNLLLGIGERERIKGFNARYVNNRVSFASITMDEKLFPAGRGPPCLSIHGSIHHRLGALQGAEGERAQFLQTFFYTNEGQQPSVESNPDTRHILQDIIAEITTTNPIILSIKSHLERNGMERMPLFRLELSDETRASEAHSRTYNDPCTTEVAAIVIGQGETPATANKRVIVINQKNIIGQAPKFQMISDTHSSYDPLSYVLTHMRGDCGWTFDMKRHASLKKISCMDYYSYRGQIRDPIYVDLNGRIKYHDIVHDTLLYGKQLAQQYWTDQWIKIEMQRLNFIKFNQTTIRAELYQGLADAVAANDFANVGQNVILPSSVQGSPRMMHQNYQDAMAIVRKMTKPDLFVTITCNPNWPEIQDNLRPGQEAWERPDLCARAFKAKLKEFLHEINRDHIFGVVKGEIYVIEFQKRGLPHAHILLILADNDKPKTSDDYDRFVASEIPDPETQPRLFASITTHMMHGPCGTKASNPLEKYSCPCYDVNGHGECSKNFPKGFTNETTISNDSYPVYMRRDPEHGGRSFEKMVHREQFKFTNQWVVPYNPYCSLRYNCHINVEIVNSIRSVKYLYKYVYKGHDRVSVRLTSVTGTGQAMQVAPAVPAAAAGGLAAPHEPRDEVANYIDSRYVGPCEAFWRILGFDMQGRSPAVQRLQLHLPGQHSITYREGEEAMAFAAAREKHTSLTGYFACVQRETHQPLSVTLRGNGVDGTPNPPALALTYADMPTYYVWDLKSLEWTRRKRPQMSDTIGRIYSAMPSAGERFFLRMLLTKVCGVTGFDYLKLVDGIVCTTFRESCRLRGYFADDQDWIDTMTEASTAAMPKQLRQLFVTLIFNNPEVADPSALWDMFKDHMSEDHRFERARQGQNREIDFDASDYNEALHDLNDHFQVLSDFTKGNDSFALPAPDGPRRTGPEGTDAIRNELAYDHDEQVRFWRESYDAMNANQKASFDDIMSKINENIERGIGSGNEESKIIFLDAPGGTGKTFLFNTVLAAVRSKTQVAIATAFSGIAALLLKGGRTFHSRCGIPIKLNESSTCSFKSTTELGKLLKQAAVIVIDEAPMCDRFALEAFDRSMRGLMKNTKPFGGKILLLGGDFRQTLPIIVKAGRSLIVSRTIKRMELWPSVVQHKLNVNMRVMRNCEDQIKGAEFCAFLLQVGEGKIPTDVGMPLNTVKVPNDFLYDGDLLDYVYPDIHLGTGMQATASKAILSPKNADVDFINGQAMQKFPGAVVCLESADSIFDDDDGTNNDATAQYPIEFLNGLEISGMPPHRLLLKLGVPIILLRNLDSDHGLCNGTRLKVLAMSRNLIKVAILNGSHTGSEAFIPRIDLIPSNETLPFKLRRRQFPIRLAFAMTINKSQGQSLEHVGIYLSGPVFAHGQLYVAYSRSGNPNRAKVMIKPQLGVQGPFVGKEGSYTRNVVYREVLV